MPLTSNPHTCSLAVCGVGVWGGGGGGKKKKQVNLSVFDDFLGIGARGEE